MLTYQKTIQNNVHPPPQKNMYFYHILISELCKKVLSQQETSVRILCMVNQTPVHGYISAPPPDLILIYV